MPAKTGLAFSVRQPWAWLIVHGHKPVENRDWPTRLRGVVGIHAGLRFDRDGYAWVRYTFPAIALPAPGGYDLGGIVGRAELVDCVRDHPSPWFVGTYGFVFQGAEPLPFSPCRGALGFFRPDLRSKATTPPDGHPHAHDPAAPAAATTRRGRG